MLRLLLVLRKMPEWVARLAVGVTVAVATGLLVPSESLHVLELMFLPVLAFGEAVERSARFTAYIIARRNSLVIVAAISTAIFAVSIAYLFGGKMDDPKTAFLFLSIGTVLGILLRQYYGRLALAALVDKKRIELYLYCTLIWALILVLYPWTGIHGGDRPIYIAGIGFGLLIHKGGRQRIAHAAASHRRIQEVVDAFPPKVQATKPEFEALELLKRGRQFPSMKFQKLRNRIDDWKRSGEFTKRIALISTSAYRLEGEYAQSIAEAVAALETTGEPQEDAVIATLFAISLLETGRETEADKLLDELSSKSPFCPLACATRALRKAEAANFDPSNWQLSDEGLTEAMKALDLRREAMRRRASENGGQTSLDSFLTRFLDIGVPITNSFMADILGYCHLAAGHFVEALRAFEICIELDPSYSIAFLHLGDYFTIKPSRGFDNLWHAEACYRVAFQVERNEGSRVRRLARQRLNMVEHLRP